MDELVVNKFVGFGFGDSLREGGKLELLERHVEDLEKFCLLLLTHMVKNGDVGVEELQNGKLFVSWGHPNDHLRHRGVEVLPDYNDIVSSVEDTD